MPQWKPPINLVTHRPPNRVTVHTRLPPDLVNTLDTWARRARKTRTAVLEGILNEYREWMEAR